MEKGCLWQNTDFPAFLMHFMCENIFFKEQEHPFIEQTNLLPDAPTYEKTASFYYGNFNELLTCRL